MDEAGGRDTGGDEGRKGEGGTGDVDVKSQWVMRAERLGCESRILYESCREYLTMKLARSSGSLDMRRQ